MCAWGEFVGVQCVVGRGGCQAQKPGMSPPAVAQSYRMCAHPKTPPLLSASIKVSGSTTVVPKKKKYIDVSVFKYLILF